MSDVRAERPVPVSDLEQIRRALDNAVLWGPQEHVEQANKALLVVLDHLGVEMTDEQRREIRERIPTVEHGPVGPVEDA